MNKKILVLVAFGAVGAVVGFVYGRGVRANANDAVSTEFNSGVATVRLNTYKLAAGGVRDFIS